MALLLLKNCTEVFIPPPEGEETDCSSCRTGDSDVLLRDEKGASDGEIPTLPAPLLRAEMQKDTLLMFIQQKCQECLLHLDDPQLQKSYFFWSIMERFCVRNGRVMMSEFASLLFKGYSLLRRKLGRMNSQQNWCLPLAGLLCSTESDEDEQRNNVIQMGDMFASKGWTFAAHICYVVVRVEPGPRFQLIGCNRMPDRKSSMRAALERTEVYESVLSLSSEFSQSHFQEVKFIHAYELCEAGLDDQALAYCESIAVMVLRSPQCVHDALKEWVLWLSQKLFQRKKEKEPEWLKELDQLLKTRKDFSISLNDCEQFSSESEQSAGLYFNPTDHYEFDSCYTMGEMLGSGGFASVYAGVCKADGKPVAIKLMAKGPHNGFLTIPGQTLSLPLEVALMKMVSEPPRCENVVELLEWFETSGFYILVLERPVPCMDLFQICELNNGRLSEPLARLVMLQVVQAVDHCCKRGVLHRDIKPENILINPEKLHVKLIDFGCGDLLMDELYTNFTGTPSYWPPEWILHGKYNGVPATVWSLGIVLFFLVCGELPFVNTDEITDGQLWLFPDVSDECCDLIQCCLDRDPESRLTFSEILSHVWFKTGIQDPVKTIS